MQNIQQEGSMAAPLHQNREDPVIPMAEAPPKQVATAMERLSRAARLFADIRIGADRLLEVLFLAAESPQESNKTVQLILKEEGAMLQHFQDLRSLGKHLEESGVLNGSVALRGNSWGLHMPLVCPDGAVVAYAWKRQLAGQAGASAVDRTRLALKAFTDQKRRFFPHLEDDVFTQHNDGEFVVSKKPRSSHLLLPEQKNDVMEGRTLPGIINIIQGVAPDVRVYTYQRLNWLKRASLLPSSSIDHLVGASNENAIQSASNSRSGLENAASITGQTAVIELLSPSLFRAVVSLHPAGSMTPDAVAFFSPEEGGSYVHARGLSVFHVFRHVTEHADKALQYFENIDLDTSLLLLLRWICSYQTLFSQVCSKCKRLLVMDESLGLILPPVHRTYHQTSASKSYPNQLTSSDSDLGCDFIFAYHIGCSVDDS